MHTTMLKILLITTLIAARAAFPTSGDGDHDYDDDDMRDGEKTLKILGQSVVTSVSVVMQGQEPHFTDAAGYNVPRPKVPPQVASPITLLTPDRYEFYTFDNSGQLVKRLMTMPEIQSIVAGGESDGNMNLQSIPIKFGDKHPATRVEDVLNSVQSVLSDQMEVQKNISNSPVLDTPDVSSTWSMILPAIFGNTGDAIVPHRPQQIYMTPDSDIVEPTEKNPLAPPVKEDPKPLYNRPRPTPAATTASTHYERIETITAPSHRSTTEATVVVQPAEDEYVRISLAEDNQDSETPEPTTTTRIVSTTQKKKPTTTRPTIATSKEPVVVALIGEKAKIKPVTTTANPTTDSKDPIVVSLADDVHETTREEPIAATKPTTTVKPKKTTQKDVTVKVKTTTVKPKTTRKTTTVAKVTSKTSPKNMTRKATSPATTTKKPTKTTNFTQPPTSTAKVTQPASTATTSTTVQTTTTTPATTTTTTTTAAPTTPAAPTTTTTTTTAAPTTTTTTTTTAAPTTTTTTTAAPTQTTTTAATTNAPPTTQKTTTERKPIPENVAIDKIMLSLVETPTVIQLTTPAEETTTFDESSEYESTTTEDSSTPSEFSNLVQDFAINQILGSLQDEPPKHYADLLKDDFIGTTQNYKLNDQVVSHTFADNQLYVEEGEPIVSDFPTTEYPTTEMFVEKSSTEKSKVVTVKTQAPISSAKPTVQTPAANRLPASTPTRVGGIVEKVDNIINTHKFNQLVKEPVMSVSGEFDPNQKMSDIVLKLSNQPATTTNEPDTKATDNYSNVIKESFDSMLSQMINDHSSVLIADHFVPPPVEIQTKEPIVAMAQKREPLPARKDEPMANETQAMWANKQEGEVTNIASEILNSVGFIIDTEEAHQPDDEEIEDHENEILISNITSALIESVNFNNLTLTDLSIQSLSDEETTSKDSADSADSTESTVSKDSADSTVSKDSAGSTESSETTDEYGEDYGDDSEEYGDYRLRTSTMPNLGEKSNTEVSNSLDDQKLDKGASMIQAVTVKTREPSPTKHTTTKTKTSPKVTKVPSKVSNETSLKNGVASDSDEYYEESDEETGNDDEYYRDLDDEDYDVATSTRQGQLTLNNATNDPKIIVGIPFESSSDAGVTTNTKHTAEISPENFDKVLSVEEDEYYDDDDEEESHENSGLKNVVDKSQSESTTEDGGAKPKQPPIDKKIGIQKPMATEPEIIKVAVQSDVKTNMDTPLLTNDTEQSYLKLGETTSAPVLAKPEVTEVKNTVSTKTPTVKLDTDSEKASPNVVKMEDSVNFQLKTAEKLVSDAKKDKIKEAVALEDEVTEVTTIQTEEVTVTSTMEPATTDKAEEKTTTVAIEQTPTAKVVATTPKANLIPSLEEAIKVKVNEQIKLKQQMVKKPQVIEKVEKVAEKKPNDDKPKQEVADKKQEAADKLSANEMKKKQELDKQKQSIAEKIKQNAAEKQVEVQKKKEQVDLKQKEVVKEQEKPVTTTEQSETTTIVEVTEDPKKQDELREKQKLAEQAVLIKQQAAAAEIEKQKEREEIKQKQAEKQKQEAAEKFKESAKLKQEAINKFKAAEKLREAEKQRQEALQKQKEQDKRNAEQKLKQALAHMQKHEADKQKDVEKRKQEIIDKLKTVEEMADPPKMDKQQADETDKLKRETAEAMKGTKKPIVEIPVQTEEQRLEVAQKLLDTIKRREAERLKELEKLKQMAAEKIKEAEQLKASGSLTEEDRLKLEAAEKSTIEALQKLQDAQSEKPPGATDSPMEKVPVISNEKTPEAVTESVPLIKPTAQYSDTFSMFSTPDSSFGLDRSTMNLSESISEFTDLCNELALILWKSLERDGISTVRSLVVSPFAISSMLSMLFLGARGSTSSEMNEILKLDDMVTFNPHLVLRNVTDSVEMARDENVAAAAFVRVMFADKNKGKISQFFKEKSQQFYSSHVEEVSFNVVNDIIRRRTNLLVKRHTHGKIAEYLKTNNIWLSPPLAALSINIFQTNCAKATVNERDGEMFFQVSPAVRQRRLVPIPAVVYKSGFLAGYDPALDATAVAFGNADDVTSTIFLMPGQQGHLIPGDSLDRLEKTFLETAFTKNSWKRILMSLAERPGLEIQIPRFSHKSLINTTNTLHNMGFKDVFNADKADLRGLTESTSKDLHLSDILQINTFSTCGEGKIQDQHHIEIYPAPALRRNLSIDTSNEQMVYASSSVDYQRAFDDPIFDTKYIELPLSLRPRQARIPETPRLKFDRPFLYFVRHNPTGIILFMGRFNPRLLP